MPLDAEAQAIIDRVDAAGIAPWHTFGDVTAARRVYEERTRLLASSPLPVASVRDLEVPGETAPLPARAYHPDPGRVLPVLLYLHGGGWVLGSLDTHDGVCRELAVTVGAVVLAPAYRLAPEHPHPAALEDAWRVLGWLATSAGAIGGDPSRIGVAGDSAGGHLTAALCLLARDRRGPRIAAQVPIYPALEPRFDTPSMLANREGYLLTRDDLVWFWGHYLQGRRPGPDGYAAPLLAADVSGLPPALVVTAEYDPLRDEGRAWVARLATAGVCVELAEYAGVTHNFVVLPGEMPKGRDAVARIAAWLRRAWS
jgi:acetyl esterase